MSKAVVDPAELRRFAQDLKRFNAGLLNQMAVIQSRLNDLGQSWRDQEHKKFAEEFDLMLKAQARLAEATEKSGNDGDTKFVCVLHDCGRIITEC